MPGILRQRPVRQLQRKLIIQVMHQRRRLHRLIRRHRIVRSRRHQQRRLTRLLVAKQGPQRQTDLPILRGLEQTLSKLRNRFHDAKGKKSPEPPPLTSQKFAPSTIIDRAVPAKMRRSRKRARSSAPSPVSSPLRSARQLPPRRHPSGAEDGEHEEETGGLHVRAPSLTHLPSAQVPARAGYPWERRSPVRPSCEPAAGGTSLSLDVLDSLNVRSLRRSGSFDPAGQRPALPGAPPASSLPGGWKHAAPWFGLAGLCSGHLPHTKGTFSDFP